MFIPPIQVQMLLAVAVPTCWQFAVSTQCSELLYNTSYLADGNCTCRVGKVQRIFISGQIKVIPLFRYSVFRVLPIPTSPKVVSSPINGKVTWGNFGNGVTSEFCLLMTTTPAYCQPSSDIRGPTTFKVWRIPRSCSERFRCLFAERGGATKLTYDKISPKNFLQLSVLI